MRLFLNILVSIGVLCFSQHAAAGHLPIPLGADHANPPQPVDEHVDHPGGAPHSHPHSSPLPGPTDHHDADDHEHGFSATRCNAHHSSHAFALTLMLEFSEEPFNAAPVTAAHVPKTSLPRPPDPLYLKVCSLLL